MGIFIKNPAVERKVRELAALTGKSLTVVIEEGVDRQLEIERKKRRRPTLEEMQKATDEFRRRAGLDKVKLNVTKVDFDALWEIPGLDIEDYGPR